MPEDVERVLKACVVQRGGEREGGHLISVAEAQNFVLTLLVCGFRGVPWDREIRFEQEKPVVEPKRKRRAVPASP
jgi:hypothetical protein